MARTFSGIAAALTASVFLWSGLPGAALAQTAPDTGGMSDAERTSLRAEIRAFLLEEPEILIEAVQALEARRAEEAASEGAGALVAERDKLRNSPADFVFGNLEGDVTVVEFLDYQCGFCKRAHDEVAALIKADPNIRLVVKEFPVLGPDSVYAARAAISALRIDQSKFAPFHNAMMKHRGRLTGAAVRQLARHSGYDPAEIVAGMEHPEVDATIAENRRLAASLRLTGTPGFVIGDEIVRGYVPASTMQELVAAARDG